MSDGVDRTPKAKSPDELRTRETPVSIFVWGLFIGIPLGMLIATWL